MLKLERKISSLLDLLALLKDNFKLLSTVFLFSMPLIYLLSLLINDNYTSSALIEVRKDDQESNLVFNSNLSRFAASAGILPSSGDKTYYVIELTESRTFLNHLLSFEGIKESLTAAKSYDKRTREIIFDDGIFDIKNNSWIIEDSESQEPTLLDSYEAYMNTIDVSRDPISGFLSIEVTHISPYFANKFLELILSQLNALSIESAIVESTKSLEYLRNLLQKTTELEVKQSITSLIEVELKKQMLAKSKDDYLIKIIDASIVPEEKSYPMRLSLSILVSLIISLGTASLIIFLALVQRKS